MWNDTVSIVSEPLRFKVRFFENITNRTFEWTMRTAQSSLHHFFSRFDSMNPTAFILVIWVMTRTTIYFVSVIGPKHVLSSLLANADWISWITNNYRCRRRSFLRQSNFPTNSIYHWLFTVVTWLSRYSAFWNDVPSILRRKSSDTVAIPKVPRPIESFSIIFPRASWASVECIATQVRRTFRSYFENYINPKRRKTNADSSLKPMPPIWNLPSSWFQAMKTAPYWGP